MRLSGPQSSQKCSDATASAFKFGTYAERMSLSGCYTCSKSVRQVVGMRALLGDASEERLVSASEPLHVDSSEFVPSHGFKRDMSTSFSHGCENNKTMAVM